MNTIPSIKNALRLAVLLAVGFTVSSSLATPYATSLTNDAGVVSFRLNQTTATNDTVWVISGGGTVTNVLQAPSDDTNNFITRGLIVTNLGIAPGTFKVYIKHVGSGVISTNSPRVPFGNSTVTGLRGIAANPNPASPYFGWVYVVNSQTNTAIAAGSRGDGMFAFGADIGSATSDILGQGNVPKTGGYNFGSAANQQASSPYHVSIAPDDSVLVTDWSDASGNLIAMDPLLDSYTYVLKPIETNGTSGYAASPVSSNNNHGSISGAFIVGTGANRVLYTSDEDYQTDPATGAVTEWNSIWRYDIGNSPFPYSNAPNRKIMTPYLATFAGQNQKVEVVGRYLYANQRRANYPQHDVYVVDLNNLQDPATFTGSTPWGATWTSQDASVADGYSNDILRDTMAFAVSPDGKWFAAINAGQGNAIITPEGVSYANAANDIIVCPLTNGIPHLAARQVFKPGGAALGRDIAFDAAHNIYFVSSGLAVAQSLDLGESTEATTGSDGTFTLVTPATQVSVSAATAVAYEQGGVPAIFTITRTPEDIANPVKVFFNITGSATNGVDYTTSETNSVTIAAGQTSTNITITPIDDSLAELSESATLSIRGSGGYAVGFPLSAIAAIVDNETPELRIASLSTNVYQGNSNDYSALQLQRRGDTNVDLTLDASSFAFGGTAVLNVDYYLANLPIVIPAGAVNSSNALIYPIAASTDVGAKTILLTNLAGTGYTVTNNTATTTLTLKAVPTGTVLFSDKFETDSSANYNVVFGTLTNAPADFNFVFSYDYVAGGVGNLPGLPPAPNSASGETKGLYMTVNKSDSYPVAAGLNAYLKNQNFSGNYALRFDMLLVQNSSPAGASQSKNETALFGIDHSGTKTNWVRNAVPGTGNKASAPPEFDSDGLFCTVEADAFSPGLNFGLWSGPTWTNTVSVVGPTNFLQRAATTTREIFKKPPFDAGPSAGGVPANTVLSATPTWVEVELSQIGNRITWKINNTVIAAFTNTSPPFPTNGAPVYTNGTIMLGYNDPWDDIGNQTAGSGEACVIYDNVRVVSIAPPTVITHPSNIVAAVGTTTNLSVVASTVTGVTNYQWLRNGTNLVGQTSATLNFAPLANANFGGNYSVAVSDGAYTTWSAVATVLPPPPTVDNSPVGKVVPYGLATSFTGSGTTFSGATNYLWLKGSPLTNFSGANYSGTNTTTLNIAAVVTTNVGPYALRIGDGFNFVTSSVANLKIADQPTIASELSGSTLNLSFPTEIGPKYVVEWKGALTNGAWNPLSTNDGTGAAILVPDSTQPDAQRFYRVRMQ